MAMMVPGDSKEYSSEKLLRNSVCPELAEERRTVADLKLDSEGREFAERKLT